MKRRSKHSTRPYQLSTKRELVKMVTGIIKEMKEEKSNTKIVQLAKQGACIRLGFPLKELSHTELVKVGL